MTHATWSSELYVASLRFAAERHAGQLVPGSELPYLVHVVSVAAEVVATLADEPFDAPDLAVQCALLHDTLEDTETSFEELSLRFGLGVAEGVRALSKDSTLPKAERMADSLRRIREQPREIWLVKLADRVTNLAPAPPHWTRDKRTKYREEARAIHMALGEASRVLGARLLDKIARYEV